MNFFKKVFKNVQSSIQDIKNEVQEVSQDVNKEIKPDWEDIENEKARKSAKIQILEISENDQFTKELVDPGFRNKFDLVKYATKATLMLKLDSKLGVLRNKIVPKSVSEEEFWLSYFFRIEEVMEEYLVVIEDDISVEDDQDELEDQETIKNVEQVVNKDKILTEKILPKVKKVEFKEEKQTDSETNDQIEVKNTDPNDSKHVKDIFKEDVDHLGILPNENISKTEKLNSPFVAEDDDEFDVDIDIDCDDDDQI